jgi:branched-chain amino acid transport system substrate-binding protein
MNRRVLSVVAGLSVAALAACSSSSKSTSSTTATSSVSSASSAVSSPGTTGAAVSAPGISNGQILIGSVAGPDAPGWADGVNAAVNAFNQAGGIDGLKIKVAGNLNNNDDGNTDLTDIQQLVLQDHVYAVLLYPTVTEPAAGTFLQQHGVPYLGYGFAPVMCDNPYGFGFQGCVVPLLGKQPAGSLPEDQYFTRIVPSILPTIKGAKVALVGQSVNGGQLYTNIFAQTAKALGADVVYNQAVLPLTSGTSYQPFASAVMATKPDLVNIIAGTPSDVAMKAQLIQDGYKGAIVDEATYSPNLLSDPATAKALEGTYAFSETPTLLDTSPFAKQMQAAFAADHLASSAIGEGTLTGYMAADFFIGLLKQVAPNFSKFVDTVNAGMKYSPDGGWPSSWPDGHSTFVSACLSITKVTNGQYTLVDPYKCSL